MATPSQPGRPGQRPGAQPRPNQPRPGQPGYSDQPDAGGKPHPSAALRSAAGIESIGMLIAQLVLGPVLDALQSALSLSDADVCDLLMQISNDRGCETPLAPPEPVPPA